MNAKSHTGAFDIGSLSERGRRSNNEDRVLRVEDWQQATREQRHELGRLYVVADGVGGNDNGEDASDRVVNGLMRHYYQGEHPEGTAPTSRLRRAIELTTGEIFAESVERNNNMRSTVVAALVLDQEGRRDRRRLVIANVGDSPAILFRKGQLPRKLSQDHVKRDQSLAQAMGDEAVAVTMFNDQLLPDDIVVICSDGLSDGVKGPLTLAEIGRVIHSMPAQAASAELVRMAIRKGSQDNVSAIVIRNGDRPPPVRQIMQAALVVVALAVMGFGIFAAGFVQSGGDTADGGGPALPFFGSQGDDSPALAPTVDLEPTLTPTPTPTATQTTAPTKVPPKPQQPTPAAPGAVQVTATPVPGQPDPNQPAATATPPPASTPEPPTNTPEPPTPTNTSEPPDDSGGDDSGGDDNGDNGGDDNPPTDNEREP